MLMEISSGNYISLTRLVELLNRRPFDLKKTRENALVSRYIIEDNARDENPRSFDINTSNETVVVVSIMKNLLNNYRLFTDDEVEDTKEKIRNVICHLLTSSKSKCRR